MLREVAGTSPIKVCHADEHFVCQNSSSSEKELEVYYFIGNCCSLELAAFGFDELLKEVRNSIELIITVLFGLSPKHCLENYQPAITLIGLHFLIIKVLAPF